MQRSGATKTRTLQDFCEREPVHILTPKRFRCAPQGRSGRHHIIDQDHIRSVRDRRSQTKAVFGQRTTRHGVKTRLPLGKTPSRERVLDRPTKPLSEGFSDAGRLTAPAPKTAVPRRRNRDIKRTLRRQNRPRAEGDRSPARADVLARVSKVSSALVAVQRRGVLAGFKRFDPANRDPATLADPRVLIRLHLIAMPAGAMRDQRVDQTRSSKD